jgi:hypothetical protein
MGGARGRADRQRDSARAWITMQNEEERAMGCWHSAVKMCGQMRDRRMNTGMPSTCEALI